MNKKKWVIKTLSTLILIVSVLVFTINILIDPYGEFRLIEWDHNILKLKSEKTTALQVATKLYTDKYALIFGSSRTMLLSSEIMEEPTLNFSTSIYNNPGDILAFLKILDKQQTKNITRIYVLIDVNGFHYTKSAPFLNSKNRLRIEKIRNIGPQKIKDAWECLYTNRYENKFINNNYIDDFGTLHKQSSHFVNKDLIFSSGTITEFYTHSLKEIASFCKRNKIKVTFFTVPWFKSFPEEQEKILNNILLIAGNAAGEYIDLQKEIFFAGNKNLYSDPSHLNIRGLKRFVSSLRSTPKRTVTHAEIFDFTQFDASSITEQDFINLLTSQKILIIQSIVKQIVAANRKDLLSLLYDKNQKKDLFIGFLFNTSNSRALKMLLESGKTFTNDQSCLDYSLIMAIMSGDFTMVKDAIQIGANPNAVLKSDQTPLLYATFYSPTKEIISSLLQNGADPDFINRDPEDLFFLETAYSIALKKNDINTLRLLFNFKKESEVHEYNKLLYSLITTPASFNKMDRLNTLHRKLFVTPIYLTDRIQPLPLPPNSISTQKNSYTLTLNNQTYQVGNIENYLLQNLTAKKFLGEIISSLFEQEKTRLSNQNTSDHSILANIEKKFSYLMGILNKHSLVKIVH